VLPDPVSVPSTDLPVRAVLSDDGGRVRLEVTTPGAHIPAAQCERLFDRFYRAPEVRAQGNGYGLGLALARHVARLHGGDMALRQRTHDRAAHARMQRRVVEHQAGRVVLEQR